MSIVTNMTTGGNGNSEISTNNAVVFVTIVSSHELLGTDNIITMTKGNIVLRPSLWRNGKISVSPYSQVEDKKTAVFFVPPSYFDSVNSWTVSHTFEYFTHSETIIISSNKEYSLDFTSSTYTGWVIRNGVFTNEFRQQKFSPQYGYGDFAFTAPNDSSQWQLNENLFNNGEIKNSFSDYVSYEYIDQSTLFKIYSENGELQYTRFKAYTPLIGNVTIFLESDNNYVYFNNLAPRIGAESPNVTAPSELLYLPDDGFGHYRQSITYQFPTNATTNNVSFQFVNSYYRPYSVYFLFYNLYITGNLVVTYELPPDEE